MFVPHGIPEFRTLFYFGAAHSLLSGLCINDGRCCDPYTAAEPIYRVKAANTIVNVSLVNQT